MVWLFCHASRQRQKKIHFWRPLTNTDVKFFSRNHTITSLMSLRTPWALFRRSPGYTSQVLLSYCITHSPKSQYCLYNNAVFATKYPKILRNWGIFWAERSVVNFTTFPQKQRILVIDVLDLDAWPLRCRNKDALDVATLETGWAVALEWFKEDIRVFEQLILIKASFT